MAEEIELKDFAPDDVYILHPRARLRNDKKYVIAVTLEPGGGPVARLNPYEGIVLTLFNGERTYQEIIDLCVAFFEASSDKTQESASSVVRYIASKFIEPRNQATYPLLTKRSDSSNGDWKFPRPYHPRDFIVARDKFKPNELKLQFPVFILWLVTNVCAVDCQYCYMDKPKLTNDEMLPWERIEELIREAHRGGVMEIDLSGGDPLCYPHLFQFLDLLEELEFAPFDLATKAYISPEIARRLASYKTLESLQFSIDSTVPEIADFVVQSPGFYDRTIRSIQNSLEAGIHNVVTKSVITPYTVPTVPKLYRDLKSIGIRNIRLATYCRSGFHHQDKLFNHVDDYQWLDKELDKLRAEFPDDQINYQNGPPELEPMSSEERKEAWPNRNRCTAGREGFTVCANGKVVACEQMPEREEDYLGDLRVQSMEEVWKSKRFDEYMNYPPREKFAGTACFDCEEFDECQITMGTCVRECCIKYGTRWCPPPNCPKAQDSPREM